MRRMTTRTCDVVVFGATSFVGQILTRYLFDEFGLDGELRWAAAGRSLPKAGGRPQDRSARAPAS